jgi:hypothetical protein
MKMEISRKNYILHEDGDLPKNCILHEDGDLPKNVYCMKMEIVRKKLYTA